MAMDINRRAFLGGSAAAAFAAAFGCATKERTDATVTDHWILPQRVKWGTETTSVCCFCGGGCGLIVTTARPDGATPKVVNVEGDPDHPFNEGALCSKGASIHQIPNRPAFDLLKEPDGNAGTRLVRPLKRSPYASGWTEIPWTQAIQEIAAKIKAVRDPGFVATDGGGLTVNRCETVYNLGGAALDNEECYLLSKLMRALGVVYLEHQARI